VAAAGGVDRAAADFSAAARRHALSRPPLIVLSFDPSAISPLDQTRAYTNALKFVDTQMGPADLIAIITHSEGAVRIRQDFTASRALLRVIRR
jgi:hypothetical protein